jgi:NitT/TauT family transport system permease protein
MSTAPTDTRQARPVFALDWSSAPAQRVLLLAIILGLWTVGAYFTPPYILPGPLTVAQALVEIVTRATFLEDVGATTWRVSAGFVLALVTGVPLGILFGAKRAIGSFFEPLLPIMNTVSSAIWAIFAILWFGATDAATIFVVFMTSMPLIITNTWQGTRGVSADLVEVAVSLRFGSGAILRKIYLPSILPYVFSGARLAFGFGWRVSLVAETLGSSSGIGYRIRQSADLFQIDQVFAWTLVMVGLMVFIEVGILRPLERYLFRWQKTRQL